MLPSSTSRTVLAWEILLPSATVEGVTPRMKVDSSRPVGPNPAIRTIADGLGWKVVEYDCHAGPEHRPFEERHDAFTIAGVLSGTFTYRTAAGTALLYPGAVLLGNSGHCFECRHDHGRGDRCISIDLSRELFAEIAASTTATGRYVFAMPMLPAVSKTVPWVSLLRSWSSRADHDSIEDRILSLAEAVVATTAGHPRSPPRLSSREARRITDVLRHIEANFHEPMPLAALARLAGMSRFHFARTFSRLAGVPPYQYVLSVRLRMAADRLAHSTDSISSIAFACGFGDLSTFNRQFRRAFDAGPLSYRRRATTAPARSTA
jgi:AraC family transcriptional regulator